MSGAVRTDWIWIRHASVQGQEGRYYGLLDVACEPISAMAAASVARLLPVTATWLATPLSRTRQTALALKPEVDPIEIAGFTEQDYGLWQGRTHNDVYVANRTLDWRNPASIRPPEGESFADIRIRVAEAIDRLSAHYQGHALVVVAHASTIRAAIAHALSLESEAAMRFEISPLSMTRLSIRSADGVPHWHVGGINHEALRV